MNDVGRKEALIVIGRGLRRRCPQCGVGRLFVHWYTLAESCSVCGLPFTVNEGNTWAFMYLGTGFLTGLILVAMLIFRPGVVWLGQIGVVATAVLLIVGSLPVRKGLAMAIDYPSRCGRRMAAIFTFAEGDEPTIFAFVEIASKGDRKPGVRGFYFIRHWFPPLNDRCG
jgi:uncharacterized protein (DUF983 family)